LSNGTDYLVIHMVHKTSHEAERRPGRKQLATAFANQRVLVPVAAELASTV
jgi:hypothetical protein